MELQTNLGKFTFSRNWANVIVRMQIFFFSMPLFYIICKTVMLKYAGGQRWLLVTVKPVPLKPVIKR